MFTDKGNKERVTQIELLSVPAVGEGLICEDDTLGNWTNASNTPGMRLNMNISLNVPNFPV
jgi:hypothetical protein